MRKFFCLICLVFLISPCIAENNQETLYANQLNYNRNKLEILVKKSFINERTGYSSTNYSATTYTQESYSTTWGYGNTMSNERSEVKEVSDWIIVKGGIRNLSDSEFLQTIEKNNEAIKIENVEEQKGKTRNIGTLLSLSGLGYMLIASTNSTSSSSIMSGGVIAAIGFIITAFNSSPKHYLTPDYVQEEIDNYNITLKKNLGLPFNLN